jgi:hypothetical protein
MIRIELTADRTETEVEMKNKNMSVADLQAIISNLELVKMNLLGELGKLVDVQKNE